MFIYQWFLPHITSGFRVKYGMTSLFFLLAPIVLPHSDAGPSSIGFQHPPQCHTAEMRTSSRTPMRDLQGSKRRPFMSSRRNADVILRSSLTSYRRNADVIPHSDAGPTRTIAFAPIVTRCEHKQCFQVFDEIGE